MEIPYFIFLIAYVVVVLIVGLFSFFNAYHALRFGMHTAAAYVMTILHFGISALVIAGTLLVLRTVDWSGSFSIGLPTIQIEQTLP